MNQNEIINEILSDRELSSSPLLLSWIQESAENQNTYIVYKNSHALMQTGTEMTDREILNDLKKIKKIAYKSKKRYFKQTFFKYAAILVLIIFGGYIYHLTTAGLLQEVSINEISVSEGNRSLITLPDGSEMVLVNGSKVIYPSKFIGKTREICLEGEAYLTIAHNKKKPFKVNLGDHQIEVLGTEFLVTAYPQDDAVMVDLVSGSVKMNVAKSGDKANFDVYLLEPCESLVLDKNNRSVQKHETQVDFYKYWKEGLYEFKNETFRSLALKLERIHHIKIIFEDDAISSCKFTGALHANAKISTTLEVFKKAAGIPFNYTIIKNEIYINHFKAIEPM